MTRATFYSTYTPPWGKNESEQALTFIILTVGVVMVKVIICGSERCGGSVRGGSGGTHACMGGVC